MKTFQIPTPPRDEDLKRVKIETPNGDKMELSVALAKSQGYCDFTTDDRGFINSLTDLSGEPGCPEGTIAVKPIGF
jgi:hypothetical protein